MAVEIKMPQLSDTMYSGKILGWKKSEGDSISRGDILAEVETDKANLEIESFHQGTLLKILVPASQVANVGDIIAYIGKEGEKIETVATPSKPPPPSESPKTEMKRTETPTLAVATQPTPVQAQRETEDDTHFNGSSGRVKASPLAKKLAQQMNVDLTGVRGSGPNGRIVKKDIEEQAQRASSRGPATRHSGAAQGVESLGASSSRDASRPTAPAAPPSAYALQASRPDSRTASTTSPASGGTLTPLSKMRETIARRMQESVTQAPHFYTTASVDMKETKRLRELLKSREDFKGISINHLIIKASAYALMHEPKVNRAIRDNQIYQPDSINVGIITAIEDGLLIPVIKDTHLLTLRDVVFEARAAVERARAGRPNATDLVGGTFSISNMGMFDIENFTAIINPGQGAVLAVSAIREEPVVEQGSIVVGLRMKATLSVDHRIIDGVMAGNFLKYFKEALETPALLMI